MLETAQSAAQPTGDTRRLRRSRDERILGGVAGGLGRHFGVDPVLIRITFLALVFAGGFGVIVYGLLWLLLPVESADAPPAARPVTTQQSIALGLIALGVLFLLRGLGLWFSDGIVIPVVLAATGSAIVWSRSDEDGRARWSPARGNGTVPLALDGPVSPVRIVVGVVLIAVAMAAFLAANDAIEALWGLGLAVVAALTGALLLFGPWLYRLTQQLGAERRERIRQEERAELAAHLHDSVLQTLALIQRGAHDPQQTAALARRQERELRAWLYGRGTPAADVSLAAAIHRLTDELEAHHTITVEAVVVGDSGMDERTHALVAALREACVNAAKHAGVE
ncbi:MAG: PspC domain-containing protein, partial [Nitriliruptoraceae bacterium]